MYERTMFLCYLYICFILIIDRLRLTIGITHPNDTSVPKQYMVYLTKADQSKAQYNNWICGGAIVTEDFILTSAACVRDVQFMYAISGYDRYVNSLSNEFKEDTCIQAVKKKIVFTCEPKDYDFDYARYDKWAYIDIALAKVESPFNFKRMVDPTCSWIPKPIDISYNSKHAMPGTDAIVMGWGSMEYWRKKNDTRDYNIERLQYAPVLLQSKTRCKTFYQALPELHHVIDKYMICSMGGGNLDNEGRIIVKAPPTNDGCSDSDKECLSNIETQDRPSPMSSSYSMHQIRKSSMEMKNNITLYTSYGYNFPELYFYNGNVTVRRSGQENISSVVDHAKSEDRNSILNTNNTNNINANGNKSVNWNYNFNGDSRRHGFCQNDHGGPLVTWVGGREVLIGIASVFLLRDNTCVGPYLYTSTYCNGLFLGCVLQGDSSEDYVMVPGLRRYTPRLPDWFNPATCNLPPKERGFDIERRTISWLEHPDGPAANEIAGKIIYERPQIPLRTFNEPPGR